MEGSKEDGKNEQGGYPAGKEDAVASEKSDPSPAGKLPGVLGKRSAPSPKAKAIDGLPSRRGKRMGIAIPPKDDSTLTSALDTPAGGLASPARLGKSVVADMENFSPKSRRSSLAGFSPRFSPTMGFSPRISSPRSGGSSPRSPVRRNDLDDFWDIFSPKAEVKRNDSFGVRLDQQNQELLKEIDSIRRIDSTVSMASPMNVRRRASQYLEDVGGQSPKSSAFACHIALAGLAGFVESKGERTHVAIVTNGFYGDIRPMIALAQALDKRNYTVVLFVPVNFLGLCKAHGMYAIPVFGNLQEVTQAAGGVASTYQERYQMIMCMDDWLRAHEDSCAAVEDALFIFDPACIVLGNMWETPALAYEKEFGVAVIPVFFNRWDLEWSLLWSNRCKEYPRPVLFSFSEVLDPAPFNSDVFTRVGPLGMTLEEKASSASQKLKDFMEEDGNPVVAAGWGSMIPRKKKLVELLGILLRALKDSGKRGVILGGWQHLEVVGQKLLTDKLEDWPAEDKDLLDFAKENVIFAEMAPYDWLLPQCCCFVHHGGAGAAHTAMRVGCPQVITPLWNDQFETAQLVQVIGTGIPVKSLAEMSSWDLKEAIDSAVLLKDAAEYVTSWAKDECGDQKACDLIHEFIQEKVLTGEWDIKADNAEIQSEPGSPRGRSFSDSH